MTEYERIGKTDLRNFDNAAKELILWAQDQGARIKISNRRHAVILAPNGETSCVPRNLRLANRSAQNARAGVKRLFKDS